MRVLLILFTAAAIMATGINPAAGSVAPVPPPFRSFDPSLASIRTLGLAPKEAPDEEVAGFLAVRPSNHDGEEWDGWFTPPFLHDDPQFVGWGVWYSEMFSVCGTPWQVVVNPDSPIPDRCVDPYPGAQYLNLNDRPDGTLRTGQTKRESPYVVAGAGSELWVRYPTGEIYQAIHVGCMDNPYFGCTNLWGSYAHMFGVWRRTADQWPGWCPASDYEDTAPPESPDEKPIPDPNLSPGIPKPPYPPDRPMAWVHEEAAKARAAAAAVRSPVGALDHNCMHGREIVVNSEEYLLSHEYPIMERDGKIFYPASNEALEKLGFAGMLRREPDVFGRGKRILHLANANTSIAIWPSTDWTLWDLQALPKKEHVTTLRPTGNKEIYYFDLRQVAKLSGGWVMTPEETADQKYHIYIPWSVDGSWMRSCEMRGYSIDRGNITQCPMGQWMPGSTWTYVARRGGSDAVDVIMVAQGLINKHNIHQGDDPALNPGMRISLAEDWGPLGLRAEGVRYSSFMYPLLPFLEETALVGLDAAVTSLGTKYRNQLWHDPAKFARLAEEATNAAKADQSLFAGMVTKIKEHILEKGWNWIEVGGKRIYVPISVAPVEQTPYSTGWHLRVYGVGPYGLGGWYNQTKTGGTPDPIVFTLANERAEEKTYVAVFELADEDGVYRDSYGEVVLQGWRGERLATLETKAGYEDFLDKNGNFDSEFRSRFQNQWLNKFQAAIASAEARGKGHAMVFTSQRVHDAFHRLVREELGEEFYAKNAHRIIRSTGNVIRIADLKTPPPLPPCGELPLSGSGIDRPCR